MGKGGGGGGGQTQSTSTSYQTNLPAYAQPYVETMLGATQKQLFQTEPNAQGGTDITGFQPYKAYGGTYDAQGNQVAYDPSKAVAGFQPLQQQAQQGIANLQTPGQYDAATQATMAGINNAFNAGQYQPGYFGNQFRGPGQYAPGQFSMMQAQAPQLQQYQMGPAQQVGTQDYTGANVSQYMSPYMQNVVDVQQQEAKRQSDILGTQQAGQAVQAGAFGGSRAGLLEAERQRNLATQLGNIQATGSQAAFQNAQQQFNAQQQANMQAALANQQAGLTVGQQNLGAQLGIQQLGAGQNLQAQLANQQALQAAQQAAEQSRQFGAGQAMTAAQQRAQYGLAGQQLGEQSRQYGAGLGLQGTQAAMQGAGQLAGIGGQQLQAQQGILGLQNQIGAQQQQQQQQIINQAMQDYANAQQYPLMQLGFMSNMLRGLPMQATTTQQYAAAPNYVTQGIGALGAGANIYNAFKAKGGVIKEMAKGGIASVPKYDVGGEVYGDLMDMEPDQLQREIKETPSQRVRQMAQGILAEKQAQQQAPKSGIVAFGGGGETGEETAGEKEAQQNMPARQAQSPEGILGAGAPTPAPAPGMAVQGSNLPPELKGIYGEAIQNAEKSLPAIIAERAAAMKAAGAPEVAPGREEQRANLMAERANAADEAKRQRHLRLAEFFAQWGSTPGPVLAAGLNAFKDKAAGLINDEKENKKMQRELDKAIADIDQADRLEKVGQVDKAMAIKDNARAIVQRLNEKVYDFAQARAADESRAKSAEKVATISADASRYHTEAQERMAKLQAETARLDREARRLTDADNKAFNAYSVAQAQEQRVLAKITDQASSKVHLADLDAIKTAQMAATDDKGNFDPSKIPAPLRPNYDAAIKRIQERTAAWDAQKKQASELTDAAASRVRINPAAKEEGAAAPSSFVSGEFPAPSTAAISALKANPDKKADFDAKFGPGAANEYLRK